jgi:TPP-dependent pyruvate/acetoin dehydrogenase alpha subunit
MTPKDAIPDQPTLACDDAVEFELTLLRRMHLVRSFEEEVQRLFAKGLIRGTTHLCQGQEAVAIGACAALAVNDTMTCTYRGHGAVLGRGVAPDEALGEMIGKSGGLCGGKGGSMHLTDVTLGAMGANGIVGGHLPIAVGLAFAAKYRSEAAVSLCFFGDGCTNIGAFHESMNLASIWKLPAVFVCENNLYGEYSPIALTTPVLELFERASAYAMRALRIDGNDVLEVHGAVAEARARACAGEGPTFIEAMTYRQVGHSRSDPAKYRPVGELEAWLAKDPIRRSEERLRSLGVAGERVAALRAEAVELIAAASRTAQSWPDPPVESRLEKVFA